MFSHTVAKLLKFSRQFAVRIAIRVLLLLVGTLILPAILIGAHASTAWIDLALFAEGWSLLVCCAILLLPGESRLEDAAKAAP